MSQVKVQLLPHPYQVEAFRKLVNGKDLVPMKIVIPFAPYSKDGIAGFDPEMAARLYVRKEAVPVDDKGQIVKIEEPPVEEKALPPQLVEIPLNWADLHHLERVAIAKKIIGDRDRKLTVPEADETIVAELKRRESDAEQQNAA